jgi:hypothetical protein
MEEQLMEAENWAVDEHGGVARGRLGLAEEGRSSFEKSNLRTLTDPAKEAVDGAM